ncbi:MAG: hypothetical protein AB7R55_12285 [Gemmatimonadales bacterium]
MRIWMSAVVLATVAGFAPPAVAQAPAADPKDVGSIDGIMAAVYDVISGPKGEKRNWDRWRSLFVGGARLIPTGKDQQGNSRLRVMTPEDFITSSGASMEENGFFEVEIGRVTERYGNVVQAFSSYESRRTLQDEKPFARGVNSFQLFYDGARWWVVSIFWEGETPGNPIPAKYINKK